LTGHAPALPSPQAHGATKGENMNRKSPGAWLLLATLTVALTLLVADTATAAGAADYNLYFGDLHSHTNVSDGYGTPWEAYEAAWLGGVDFFATTDPVHCSYGQEWLSADNWADTLAAADAYNEDGEFITLPGYEQWIPWMTCGEMNIYNTTEVYGQSHNPAGNGLNNGHKGDLANFLPNLYDRLDEEGAIGQWNHPDYYGNDSSANSDTERYYFVGVTTASDFWGNEGVTAWTAPVWTGR
jgi:hypothetical protein